MRNKKMLRITSVVAAALACAVWSLTGCSSPTTDGGGFTAEAIEFRFAGDEIVTVFAGAEWLLTLEGPEQEVLEAQWSSSDEEIALPDETGLVTAKKAGTAIITASSGTKEAKVTFVVKEKPTKAVSITGPRTVMIGIGASGAATLGLEGDWVAGASSFNWVSADTTIALITGSGAQVSVQGLKDGSTTVTIYMTTQTGQIQSDTVNIVVSTLATKPNEEIPLEGSAFAGYEFNTDLNGVLAYAFTNGGIEIRANPDGKGWLVTSFVADARLTRGWYYDLNGRGMKQYAAKNSPTYDTTGYNPMDPESVPLYMVNGTQRDARNGVELKLDPQLITVNNIPYLLIVHTLTNTSEEPVTGQKFGVYSDVMLGNYDNTPIKILPEGDPGFGNILLTSPDPNLPYRIDLICKTGEPVTPVSTAWIGQPNKNNPSGKYGWQHIYVNPDPSTINTDGSLTLASNNTYKDSAFAFSYQDIDLQPGGSKVFLIRFTLFLDKNEPEEPEPAAEE